MEKKLLFLRGGIHKEFAFRTLFRENCEVIIMDTPNSKELPYADHQFLIEDIHNTQEMFEVAVKIYDRVKFDGICTFMTSPILALGMLSDYFNLNYFSENVALILSNKYETRKYLHKIEADNVKFYKITSVEDLRTYATRIGYPFILKPTDNASGRGVNIVRKEDEIESAYNFAMQSSFNKELIMEEFIKGDEYCVEVLIYNSIVHIISFSKKIVTENTYCIELMDITPAPLEEDLKIELENYMINTVSKFNIQNSLIHIEFKINKDNKPVIIEINPRAAGANLIESIYHLYGVNIYDSLFNISLKNNINMDVIKKKLKRENSLYSLFYSFISPTRSGFIRKIKGIERVRENLTNNHERLILDFKEGDLLQEPKTNLDFRGSIYIFGEDYNNLISRAKKIESDLVYEFEEIE